MQTKIIAAYAFDAISRHCRLIDTLGYGNTETRFRKSRALGKMQSKVSARNATSLAEHGLIFSRGAYTRTAREALAGREFHVPAIVFGLDAETRATLGTTTGKNLAATDCCHAGAETVVTFALDIARLISTFGSHDATRLKIMRERLESIDNFTCGRQAGCAWRMSYKPLDWVTPTYPQQPRAAGIPFVYVNCLAPLSRTS